MAFGRNMVGNQIEAAKPEVQASPEISKKSTKEVSVMGEIEEKRKESGGKGWFPFTEKQASETGWAPSMEGKGYEEVQLRRPDLWGDISRGGIGGIDTMQTREVVRFLYEKFDQSATEGRLPEVYDHYIDQVKKAGIFSETVIKVLENFKSEIKKARGWKGQRECVKQLEEYFHSTKMEKRQK
jgi:hypothetical protein